MFRHREAGRSGAGVLAGLGEGDQQVERGADRFWRGGLGLLTKQQL